MNKHILIACAFLVFSVGSASAEEPMEAMGNIIESMTIEMMKVYTNPKTADIHARYCKNLYEALQKQGFNKEQSIKIVTSQCSLRNIYVQ
ncbi:MAG: hypothetical protein ACC657_18935 [Thiohalomonadales bacterium]